jgi:membrane-associated phospholipid phosphatase
MTPPSQPPPPFLRWPGAARLLYAARLALAPAACWVVVFHGADWLTAAHTWRVPVHLAAERRLPFVPQAVLVYQSELALLALAPFVLRSRGDLRALARTFLVVILVAGLGFLLVPAETAYPPQPAAGPWAGAIAQTKRLALRHNLVPSLHVALGVACVAAYSARAGPAGQALMWGWAGAIALSTLLLHQHHLLDVGTGWALGLAGARRVSRRLSHCGLPEPLADRQP